MQIYTIIDFYKAFDGGIFRVGGEGVFFLYQLNVNSINLESGRLYKAGGFSHRADRRVEGGYHVVN
jgi:hypothetical protein